MIELLVLCAIALFVLMSMWRGDRIAERQGTDISQTPSWVTALFFLVVTGLLFACLGPALIAGLEGAQP